MDESWPWERDHWGGGTVGRSAWPSLRRTSTDWFNRIGRCDERRRTLWDVEWLPTLGDFKWSISRRIGSHDGRQRSLWDVGWLPTLGDFGRFRRVRRRFVRHRTTERQFNSQSTCDLRNSHVQRLAGVRVMHGGGMHLGM